MSQNQLNFELSRKKLKLYKINPKFNLIKESAWIQECKILINFCKIEKYSTAKYQS